MLRIIIAIFLGAGYTQILQYDHDMSPTTTIIIWVILAIIIYVELSLDKWMEDKG